MTFALMLYVVLLVSVDVFTSTALAVMCAAVKMTGEPKAVEPLYNCTLSPATALVPPSETLTLRSVSFVLAPAASTPGLGPTSSNTDAIVGALGAEVSTVSTTFADARLLLPATSMTFALML